MTLVHEKCGIGESGEEVWQFTTDMMVDFYENDVKMKAGALDFLEYLYGEGVKMCIASATAPNLIGIAMKTCGLGKYFSKVISCNDVGKGKEHPDVFIAAHEYLGTSKDSTWVFEDSVAAIETAVSAGYKTVGIYDQYNFGLDRIPSIATVYIDKGESLAKLIKK
jgi:HAD superfamily hydrolase (TIGR01509 family)